MPIKSKKSRIGKGKRGFGTSSFCKPSFAPAMEHGNQLPVQTLSEGDTDPYASNSLVSEPKKIVNPLDMLKWKKNAGNYLRNSYIGNYIKINV